MPYNQIMCQTFLQTKSFDALKSENKFEVNLNLDELKLQSNFEEHCQTESAKNIRIVSQNLGLKTEQQL